MVAVPGALVAVEVVEGAGGGHRLDAPHDGVVGGDERVGRNERFPVPRPTREQATAEIRVVG